MIANVMGNLINIFLVSDEKSVLFYWVICNSFNDTNIF